MGIEVELSVTWTETLMLREALKGVGTGTWVWRVSGYIVYMWAQSASEIKDKQHKSQNPLVGKRRWNHYFSFWS